ncbi:MAG: hypothetical protein Q7T18_10570 [Sedimentisphaerales bacterium]|nr:hypothetical protein [Sedimentisphaerales bacterium]
MSMLLTSVLSTGILLGVTRPMERWSALRNLQRGEPFIVDRRIVFFVVTAAVAAAIGASLFCLIKYWRRERESTGDTRVFNSFTRRSRPVAEEQDSTPPSADITEVKNPNMIFIDVKVSDFLKNVNLQAAAMNKKNLRTHGSFPVLSLSLYHNILI